MSAAAHLVESWKHEHSFSAAPPELVAHWLAVAWHLAMPASNFSTHAGSTVLAAAAVVVVASPVAVVFVVSCATAAVATPKNKNKKY